MFEADAEDICGPRYEGGAWKRGHRWGTTRGNGGFYGCTIDIERPRIRDRTGKEIPSRTGRRRGRQGFQTNARRTLR